MHVMLYAYTAQVGVQWKVHLSARFGYHSQMIFRCHARNALVTVLPAALPISEDVDWFVFTQPAKVTDKQVRSSVGFLLLTLHLLFEVLRDSRCRSGCCGLAFNSCRHCV